MRSAAILLLLATAACTMNQAQPVSTAAKPAPRASLVYPATERQEIVETQFGVPVADPYRWLENDVRQDSKVAAWVAQQNALTDSYWRRFPAALFSSSACANSSITSGSACLGRKAIAISTAATAGFRTRTSFTSARG
jgi:hypothetical protein